MLLSYSNTKLKRDGIAAWTIPAGKTCPQAGQCLKKYYAIQGFFMIPNIHKAHMSNYQASKRLDFVGLMNADIIKQKPKIVRIHAAGDFYNDEYFSKWIKIAFDNPKVRFYAYTKMVAMIKGWAAVVKMPTNLTIIFSQGGKQDSMISATDRHSRVFSSITELRANGYSDTTKNDIRAMGKNNKVGLVYHGAKSKKWASQ